MEGKIVFVEILAKVDVLDVQWNQGKGPKDECICQGQFVSLSFFWICWQVGWNQCQYAYN